MPPPRYIAESIVEYDGIVQNVLSSLTSSIGKEYTPTQYYIKPPMAGSNRSKSTTPLRKVTSMDSATASPILRRLSIRLPPPPDVSRLSLGSPMEPELTSPLGNAWKNVGGTSSDPTTPRIMEKLKGYLSEKIVDTPTSENSGGALNDLLMGLESFENGFLSLSEEIDLLRSANQALLKQLNMQP